MQYQYIAPDRTKIIDPDLRFIEERLRNGGSTYWTFQAGTAAIVQNDGHGSQLMLIVKESYGVLVQYCTENGENELILIDENRLDTVEEVSTYPGGNEWIVPRYYFVTVERALMAIECFLKEGTMLKNGKWVILGFN